MTIIELRGRINERGEREVRLPAGLPPGDVQVRIEVAAPEPPQDEAPWTDEEQLRHFEKVYLAPSDFEWAIDETIRFRLSHGVGMMDCLIASVCYRLQTPLFTHNLKHLTPLPGDLAQKPY